MNQFVGKTQSSYECIDVVDYVLKGAPELRPTPPSELKSTSVTRPWMKTVTPKTVPGS